MKIIRQSVVQPPTPSCHAVTVGFLGGQLVRAWFGGTAEGAADVRICLECGGVVQHMGLRTPVAHWNPVLAADGDRLWLFFKVGAFCNSWQTFVVEVKPGAGGKLAVCGIRALPAGVNGPVRQPPLRFEKHGGVYCGTSVETLFCWDAYVEAYALEPGGDWLNHSTLCRRSPPILPNKSLAKKLGRGLIQPMLWREPGRGGGQEWHLLARTEGGRLAQACGHGLTWGSVWDSGMAHPSSAIFVVTRRAGDSYLFYNDHPAERRNLSVARIEAANPLRLGPALLLEAAAPPGHGGSTEVSYPAAAEDAAGNLEIAWTRGRQTLGTATVEA